MSKSADNLNRLHRDFAADPVGYSETFWSVVRLYIDRCCYLVPERFKQDLVQDIVVEVMTHLHRFKPGTDFQKWLSAIVRNLRADSIRVNLYERRETPFSQLGAWDEDGGYAEFELPGEDCPDNDADEIAEPSEAERVAVASARLDAVRAQLKKRADLELFDLLRSGLSLAQAAMRMGTTYSAVQRRFARWKKKLNRECLTVSDRQIEIVDRQEIAA